MLAYNSDATLKRDMLAELSQHRKMDQIIKGTYGQGSNGDFKGCAVGCSIHSLNRKRGTAFKYGDHAAYERGFGIPRQLAHLEDRIFENLPDGLHVKWPERFMRSINPGMDLSLVMPKFMLWLLMDRNNGVIRFVGSSQNAEVAIRGVAALYQRLLRGDEIKTSEWEAARHAAYAAYADAPDAAAAAYAAAYAAYADAAAAADAAAYAAYAAAAAAAYARKQHWIKMADKLVALLRAAK